MDNQIFRVNGREDDQLLDALSLIFKLTGHSCSGWSESKKNGLVLHWTSNTSNFHPFPNKNLSAKTCFEFAKEWLKGDFAKTVNLEKWCENIDHDGHNELGWLIYNEDWGHVDDQWSAICGIKPSYCWYGK